MDNQDIRTLRILEEIESHQSVSQRDLARTLNLSLGLVNSFVKRMARKGYFKITTIPKNRARYVLTPKGAAEKTRLTYEFIQYSFQFYKTARGKMQVLLEALSEEKVRRVVFYGASDLAEIAYISLQETPIELVAVVDDFKVGDQFLGRPIVDPSRLATISYDRIIVTAIKARDAILKRIASSDLSIEIEKVAWLD